MYGCNGGEFMQPQCENIFDIVSKPSRRDEERVYNAANNIRPTGVNRITKTMMFRTTVAQNTERNSALEDLCRKNCCASRAPGQPPASASMCKAPSVVRHCPRCAFDLSSA